MLPLVYFAFPIFLLLLYMERARFRALKASALGADLAEAGGTGEGLGSMRGYFGPDTRASLMMGVGNVLVGLAVGGVVGAGYFWLYQHRLFEIGTGFWAWVLLFFAEDCLYYWWHRASHEVRFLWAAHENHHSSQYFNYSTALRQSYTTPFTVPLFYWVLPLLGFHPLMVVTQISISLIYQFWIHTELVGKLPRWFEFVCNTPSHHRVHHGANVEYLDRNHAGILIIWDRLFGTFEPERAPVVYGLTKNIETFNPLRIAFHEWADMLRAIRNADSWRARLGYFFAPPGWSPDGSTQTADQMRASLAMK